MLGVSVSWKRMVGFVCTTALTCDKVVKYYYTFYSWRILEQVSGWTYKAHGLYVAGNGCTVWPFHLSVSVDPLSSPSYTPSKKKLLACST